MKVYYKTDGDTYNYPSIILTENRKVIEYWVYEDDVWIDYKFPHILSEFKPKPYRIRKAEAERILFIDAL